MSDSTTKHCNRCGKVLPATTDYFYKLANGQPGFRTPCKACRDKKQRPISLQWSKNHVAENNARQKCYRQTEAGRRNHRDRERRWRAAHRREVRLQEKRYRDSHQERIKYLRRKRYFSNPVATRQSSVRRAAAKRNLPTRFNHKDWLRCLDYWYYCCVYCGNQQGFLHYTILSIDHFIPVSDPRPDNPGTVPENILPACLSCNTSKCDKYPETFLIDRFGKRKAKQLMVRIAKYFDFVKNKVE